MLCIPLFFVKTILLKYTNVPTERQCTLFENVVIYHFCKYIQLFLAINAMMDFNRSKNDNCFMFNVKKNLIFEKYQK